MRRKGSDTTWAVEGARNSSLQRQIDELNDAIGEGPGGGTPITAPVLCPGGFYVVGADERLKRGLRVTFCVDVPAGTIRIRTVIIKVSDATTAANYNTRRINAGYEITDGRTHLEYKFTELLDYNTQYRLIRLVAIGEVGPRTFFPLVEQAFSDSVPAAMLFTTPEQFGVPPFPALADIDTKLDPETDGYDAYAFVTNRCPLNVDTGLVQTYRQAGITWIQNIITRDYGGTTGVVKIPARQLLTEEELDATDPLQPGRGIAPVKFRALVPGGNYTLTEATVHSGEGGKRRSTGSVAFIAGSLTRAIAALTNVDVVFTTVEPFDDGNWVDVALEFTQPWPGPVSLRHVTQDYKKTTQTDWKQVGDAKDPRPQSDIYHKEVNAGTVSVIAGQLAIGGTGTQMTRWEAGWKVKVGAQTFTIAVKPTSDSLATLTAPIGFTAIGQPYTVVMRMPLNRLKVKPGLTYNHTVRLNARGEDQLTLNDTVVIGPDGHVINDTDVPSGLNAPGIDWTPSGRLRIRGMRATTNVATLKNKYIVLSDGTSHPVTTRYLEILSRSLIQGTVNEPTARFEIGLKSHTTLVDIKKKIFKDVFTPTGNFSCYWYAENDFGPSLPSGISNVLNVATMGSDIIADGSNGVGQVDVGAGMNTKTQILQNGDFHYEQSATVLRHWHRRVSPFTASTNITTTDTEDIWWDRDDDMVVWENNASRLYAPLKKWIKGKEVVTITFMAKTNGSLFNPLINIRVRLNDNTDIAVAPVPCTLTGINGSYQMFGGTLQIIDNPGTNNRFLSFETAHLLTDTNAIHIDKAMLVRGRDPAAYAPKPEYEPGAVDEDPDTTPTATPAALPDMGTAAGFEGGFFAGAGQGGHFNVAQ